MSSYSLVCKICGRVSFSLDIVSSIKLIVYKHVYLPNSFTDFCIGRPFPYVSGVQQAMVN